MFFLKACFRISCYVFLCFFFLGLNLSSFAYAQTEPVFYGEEVIVTAARYPQFVSDVPWSVSVISEEELDALGVSNVGDAVKMVVGADVKSEGGLGALSSIKLRGSSSSQIVILVDGMRVNSVLLGEANPGDILVSDVERIEVVRAPLSAIYGADAVGGVINVITKKPEDKAMRTALETSGGTFSTYKFNLSNSYGGSDLDYFLNAGYLSSGGFRANGDYNSQSYFLEVENKVAKDDSVGIVFDHFKADRGTPFTITAPMLNARRWDSNLRLGLSYKTRYTPRNQLEAKIYSIRLDQTFNYDVTSGPDEKYLSEAIVGELQDVLDVSENWRLSGGFEIRDEHGKSDAAGDHVLSNTAVFVQSENKIGKDSVIFGVRGDNNSQFGQVLNPRAGIVLRPHGSIAVKTSYGLSYRAPTQNDLFWYQLAAGSFMGYSFSYETKGNQSLRPERGDMFDLSFEFNPTSRTKIVLSAYESTIKDLIRWEETYHSESASHLTSTWEVLNIASANMEGLEISLEHRVFDPLKVFVNYTIENSVDLSAGKQLDYTPRDKYNVGIRYRDESGNAGSLSLRYIGERFADKDNTRKLPAYTVVDASLSKEFGAVTVSLNGENIFDAQYEEAEGYPMPGRAGYIGVKVDI